MSAGFTFQGTMDGGADPLIRLIPVVDTAVIPAGALVNLETGEADLAVTGDSALLGVAVEAVDNTDDGEYIHVICNPLAIYSVTDANARVMGATLDIATGALGVATSSNADLIVVEPSTATEPTKVMLKRGEAAFLA